MQEEKRLRYYIDQGYQDGYTLETIEGSGGFGSVFKLKDNSVEGVYKAVKMITVPKNMEEARFYYKKAKEILLKKGTKEPDRKDNSYAQYQKALHKVFYQELEELVARRMKECLIVVQLNANVGLNNWRTYQSNIVRVFDRTKKKFPPQGLEPWEMEGVQLENISVDILLAQEYIGENLGGYIHQRLLSKQPFTTAEVVEFGRQITGAICLCHSESILHRDIKPANILIKRNQREVVYVLADYGSAKNYFPGDTMTHGLVGSTPAYACPTRSSTEYGMEVDIYSVGKIMKYMLTGKAPSVGERMSEVDFSGCDKELVAVIQMACPHYIDSRPQGAYYKNASEFHRGLEALGKPKKDGNAEMEKMQQKIAELEAEKAQVQKALEVERSKKAMEAEEALLNNASVAKAQYEEGQKYYNGEGVDKDYDKAFDFFQKSANQGDVMAQKRLGTCYHNGYGVKQDYGKAVEWYSKAANQGEADAQTNLGVCYQNGCGVKQDYGKAVEWYTRAADQGEPNAQTGLGNCYHNGYSVMQDYAKAVEWYTKAANQGNAIAQSNLGTCYYYGNGVKQDHIKAVEWYTKAANQGSVKAQSNLGTCYYYGRGVMVDYAKAVEWYTKATNQGNVSAQHNLGLCYYYGKGVEKDGRKALTWFRRAADNGSEVSARWVKELL